VADIGAAVGLIPDLVAMDVRGQGDCVVQLLFLGGDAHAIILPKPENLANPIQYNDTNE
jgi:hypothetical protein